MAETFHDITFGANTLHQITSVNHNDGGTIVNEKASGNVEPAALFAGNFDEITTVTSTDLLTLLGLNGGLFPSVGSCVSGGVIEVPFKSRVDCSTVDGSAAPALIGASALLVPTSFEASTSDDASASCNAALHWSSTDGLTPGAAGSTGNTLADATYIGAYSLGKAFIGGTQIPELQSVNINPGVTVTPQRFDGGKYPQEHYLTEILPTIDLVIESIDAAMAFVGTVQAGAGGCVVYLRKRKPGSVYELDTDLVHISFTLIDTDSLVRTGAISVSENSNGTATISVHGKVLVAASTVAIP